jgi:Lrp/AsnC family transcriptional regulator
VPDAESAVQPSAAADEQALIAFEQAARERPEIMQCFSMSGDSDYLVRVVVKDVEAYQTFLRNVLVHLPAVASVNSRFALGCVKSTTRLPL